MQGGLTLLPIAVLSLLFICSASCQEQGGNLVANGSFEDVGEGVGPRWTMSGSALPSLPDDAEAAGGSRCQLLSIEAGRRAELSQDVPAPPNAEFFFSAQVKSNGRVVARAGTLEMSYHRQGEWQKLAGIIRSGAGGSVPVRFACSGLDGEPAQVRLDDVVLRPAEIPETLTRKGRFARTTLVDEGKPAAFILYPGDVDGYGELAKRVSRAIQDRTGVSLPVVKDTDATQSGPPVLKQQYRDTNLILLGRLGINRAMWSAYSRFLCATDGYYPGGDGFVVRTAANVLRNGRNHIILGGSSEAGAARAVERFLSLLPGADADGSLTLPWLLSVDLSGECLAQFEKTDKLWADNPNHPLLPPLEPGYGTVRRWYENAMGYYWSGWDSYRRRAEQCLDQVLSDRAYTHHYLIEFLVRAHTMVAEGDLLTEAQREQLDSLILSNFREFLQGSDGNWMRVFSPPYDDVTITNRHQIAPLMADLTMADFLSDHFELQGELADLVRFRRSEKHAFMDHMAAQRWGPSAPGAINSSGCHEEIVASSFRYALENERYELFESGNARRALHLEMMDHVTGQLVRPRDGQDHPLLAGMLAHYYRDGKYLRLLRTVPHAVHPTGHFMGRYVNGVHRYMPGGELAEEDPAPLAGVQIPRTMPHIASHLHSFAAGRCRKSDLPPESAMDFVSFRGGFDPADDYFAASGLAAHCAPGAILRLASGGGTWLMSSTGGYFDENALHVMRTDRFDDDPQPYPSVAKLDWHTETPDGGAVAFTLQPFAGTRWQRSVVWVKPGLFIVRDQVAALEAGAYTMTVNWHPNGGAAWDGKVWTSTTNFGRLHITPLGDDLRITENAASDAPPYHLRLVKSAALEAGQTETFITVLQATRGERPNVFSALMLDAERVLLRPTEPDTEPALVTWPDDAAATVSHPEDAGALVAAAPNSAGQQDGPAAVPAIADEAGNWRMAWEYSGLLRPEMVAPAARIGGNVIDLGRTVQLDEIRATHRRSGPWYSAQIPDGIATALPDENGGMPALDSDAWRPVTADPQWRVGVHTGNYGQAEPVGNDCQTVRLAGLEARYVRADDVSSLAFYDGARQAARRPLQLQIADVDADGMSEVFVTPWPYPKFIRKRDIEDDAVALLNADGTERFQHESPRNIQSARLLDCTGDGQLNPVLTSVDAQVLVFRPDGSVINHLDLYKMHLRFNETEGRPNTRHPAGGYTMPYSLGLWRREANGAPGYVVSRYCAFSFIDSDGEFEGVLQAGGYVAADLLPEGIDFDGDGIDEQVCLSRGTVYRIGGDGLPRIPQPNGELFYPQVYRCEALSEPAWVDTIEGPETLIFEPVTLGGETRRYVLIARDNYIGIYDGRENAWAFTWSPLVQMSAASSCRNSDGALVVSAVTRDGILWTFTWDGDDAGKPARGASPASGQIKRLDADGSGALLMTRDDGLYILREGEAMLRAAEGSFTDARFLPGTGSIVAATQDGRVVRLDPRTG